MTLHARFVLVVSLAALTVPIAAQSPADAIFREGLMLERAEGRVRDAVFRYERVVAEFPAERAVVAQAMHQLALAYEKLGDPRARLMWSRLATGAPNPFSAEARKRVEAAQAAASAGPFATTTLDQSYELGSPDGRWVVYYKPENNFSRLYLLELSTGTERLLLDVDGQASNLAWSPDSRHLAFNFSNNAQKVRDVRIVTLDGGAVRSLGQAGYPMKWTTTDELFIYRPNYAASGTDLLLLPVTGGDARRLHTDTTDACGWDVTPDARSLVLCRSRRLVLRDILSGAEQPIATGSGEQTAPMVSTDGRLVAFKSNDEGQWALYVAPLERLPISRPVRVAGIDESATAGGRRGAWWTNDGLLTMRMPHADEHIYRIDIDPTTGRAVDGPRRLTQDATRNRLPAISTDGTRIAYFAISGTKASIAVMDANGLNERPLIEQNGFLALSWRSPDEILFRNFYAASPTNARIVAMHVGTGALTEVATVEGLYSWYVPARREIMHMYPRGGGSLPGAELKAFSLADGRDRVVAKIDFLVPRLAVSPDGRRFAVSINPGGGDTAGGCELVLFGIDGTRERTLVPKAPQSCPVAMAWSPDGRFLLLTTLTAPRVMNVDTAESWPLHADLANPADIWTPGNWSPDGSFVVLTRSTRRVERSSWQGVSYDAVARPLAR